MIDSIFLFDNSPWRDHLLPLVATRPVSDLRVGIHTIREKWALRFGVAKVRCITVDYLRSKFGGDEIQNEEGIIVRGNVLPSDALYAILSTLLKDQVLMWQNEWIACKIGSISAFAESQINDLQQIDFEGELNFIRFPEDVFLQNASEIEKDLSAIKTIHSSYIVPDGSNVISGEDVFLAEEAVIRGVTLNTKSGSIYIGKNVTLEEGIFIKGPAAICDNARIKTGAKLYPNVTIGPGSTVCGEINNTVIWGNSAKGHEGYLGCAVIGEGCNLGAGTSNSNLRNDWQTVKVYDYAQAKQRDTGLLKCGLIMGDQAMVAIHTKFTTGAVVGVGAQLAISEFIPKFVPDFLWFTDHKRESYDLKKFVAMLKRRFGGKINTSNADDYRIFEHIHQHTAALRTEYLHYITK
ncbi:putative sugar nucleotidyl transferase [Sphingobacterium corticis]|uniref:Sugar nucleotidyl transferase n=1 Tax=Sphingobacterium corticis TaxID=1812823 RepID=A0ABW5NM57_9SPHI